MNRDTQFLVINTMVLDAVLQALNNYLERGDVTELSPELRENLQEWRNLSKEYLWELTKDQTERD